MNDEALDLDLTPVLRAIGRLVVNFFCAEWRVKPDDERLSVRSNTDYRKPPAGYQRVGRIGQNAESRYVSTTFWLALDWESQQEERK